MINISNEMRELIASDACHKNVRISFPNGEHEDLTNDHIVSESLSFTESVFSNTFKFGLCEASNLQFTTFDDINIKGCIINASLEYIKNGKVALTIPLGQFYVKSCKRKANSTERQIVAYTQDFISDDQESTDEFMGISPIEYLKRTAYCHKKTYELSFMKSIYSNYNMSSSIFVVDSSVPALPQNPVERVKVIYNTDGSTKYVIKILSYVFNLDPDDTNLYKIFTITQKKANTYATQIADYVGDSRDYTAAQLKAQALEMMKCSAEIRTYNSTTETSVRFFPSKPIFYPYINLTAEDKARAKATIFSSVTGYTLHTPHRIELYVPDTSTPAKWWGWDPRCIAVKRKTSGVELDTIIQIPRVKKNKKSSLYNFPYFNTLPYGTDAKEVKVKDLLEAELEQNGMFGIASRDGGIVFKQLARKVEGLTPSASLKPSSTLVPKEATDGDAGVETIRQYEYSSIWYSDNDSIPWGKVICKCKPTDDEETVTFTSDIIEGIDDLGIDYKKYDISSNAYIKTLGVDTETVQDMCDRIARFLKGFTYTPVEVTEVGLPYIEAGDWVEYITNDSDMPSIQTYVARRTLKGIQTLTDTISAEE